MSEPADFSYEPAPGDDASGVEEWLSHITTVANGLRVDNGHPIISFIYAAMGLLVVMAGLNTIQISRLKKAFTSGPATTR